LKIKAFTKLAAAGRVWLLYRCPADILDLGSVKTKNEASSDFD
jgi:hypothetical protein